jgi:acyl-CoA thioester hydrolase
MSESKTAPARAAFPIQIELPIQWGDMDAYAHVNNVVYLRWFESGRAAFFDRAGMWTDGIRGIAPIFASVECRFRAPLRYPDTVIVGVRVKDVGDDRFTLEHAVFSKTSGVLAAIGEGTVVSYDYPHQKKVALPAAWRRALEILRAPAAQAG